MPLLADLERLLERVFERSSARVFRTRVRGVQLEHRVERAMEVSRRVQGGRAAVAARYRVRLRPDDLAAVAAAEGGADALAARLAEAALVFARGHSYHLADRPSVTLAVDPSLAGGQVEVDALHADGRASDRRGPMDPPATSPGREAHDRGSPAATTGVVATATEAHPGARGTADGSGTVVFRRPSIQAPRARLREVRADGGERSFELDAGALTIGRARDNDLVLADGRVSRHHGRLHSRHGALVYTDLESTNGSRVNGIRVDEIVLGAGDRLEVGDTVLIVELLPG